jgi:hypothetical protein
MPAASRTPAALPKRTAHDVLARLLDYGRAAPSRAWHPANAPWLGPSALPQADLSYQAAGTETRRCVSRTRVRVSTVHHVHGARPARHPLLAAGQCAQWLKCTHQHVGRLRQRVLQHHVRAQPQRHAGRLADARARKQLLRELKVHLSLHGQEAQPSQRGSCKPCVKNLGAMCSLPARRHSARKAKDGPAAGYCCP